MFLLGFKVPLQYEAKDAEQRAASASLGAAQARNDAIRIRLDGEVAEAWFRLEAIRKAIRIFEQRQLPPARTVGRDGAQAASTPERRTSPRFSNPNDACARSNWSFSRSESRSKADTPTSNASREARYEPPSHRLCFRRGASGARRCRPSRSAQPLGRGTKPSHTGHQAAWARARSSITVTRMDRSSPPPRRKTLRARTMSPSARARTSVSTRSPGPPRSPHSSNRRAAASCITATPWVCLTRRPSPRKTRWAWITCPSTRTRRRTRRRSRSAPESCKRRASARNPSNGAPSTVPVRAAGRVDFDPRRTSVVALRFEGFIELRREGRGGRLCPQGPVAHARLWARSVERRRRICRGAQFSAPASTRRGGASSPRQSRTRRRDDRRDRAQPPRAARYRLARTARWPCRRAGRPERHARGARRDAVSHRRS